MVLSHFLIGTVKTPFILGEAHNAEKRTGSIGAVPTVDKDWLIFLVLNDVHEMSHFVQRWFVESQRHMHIIETKLFRFSFFHQCAKTIHAQIDHGLKTGGGQSGHAVVTGGGSSKDRTGYLIEIGYAGTHFGFDDRAVQGRKRLVGTRGCIS